jgi:hypothetical protein
VASVIGAVRATVSSGLGAVVSFIGGLPGKIGGLGGKFLSAGKSLGSKVIKGIGDGLRSAGGFVSDLAASVKHAINGALHLPVNIHGPGPLPDFKIPAFSTGTIAAPGGAALVGEDGPEVVHLPRGSKVDTANSTRNQQADGGGFPSKVALRIGDREFEAYIEEIADDRIDAADSLGSQGD